MGSTTWLSCPHCSSGAATPLSANHGEQRWGFYNHHPAIRRQDDCVKLLSLQTALALRCDKDFCPLTGSRNTFTAIPLLLFQYRSSRSCLYHSVTYGATPPTPPQGHSLLHCLAPSYPHFPYSASFPTLCPKDLGRSPTDGSPRPHGEARAESKTLRKSWGERRGTKGN